MPPAPPPRRRRNMHPLLPTATRDISPAAPVDPHAGTPYPPAAPTRTPATPYPRRRRIRTRGHPSPDKRNGRRPAGRLRAAAAASLATTSPTAISAPEHGPSPGHPGGRARRRARLEGDGQSRSSAVRTGRRRLPLGRRGLVRRRHQPLRGQDRGRGAWRGGVEPAEVQLPLFPRRGPLHRFPGRDPLRLRARPARLRHVSVSRRFPLLVRSEGALFLSEDGDLRGRVEGACTICA